MITREREGHIHMNVSLKMENIRKEFPGVLALDNVSFSVFSGEVFSIIGSNGAGKSTLMKVLSGAYPATTYTGNIFINGTEVRLMNPADAEKKGIAMIYQEISLMLDMSVAENIFMGNLPLTKAKIVDKKELYSNARELLDMVGLDIEPKAMVRTLSTSQQQMVSIAKALAKKPRVLVLDEPTSALTETEVKYLFDAVKHLKDAGVSCIYISHKLDEVFSLSDRIMVMRDGQVQSIFEKQDFDPIVIISQMIGQRYSTFERSKSNTDETRTLLELKEYCVKHPSIPGKNILNNISFKIHKGEIVGLLGLVGSGRSELVSSLFGYKNTSTGGQVFIDGKNTVIKSPVDAIKHGMGLLTEDRKFEGLVGMMDIRENITLANLKQISKRGLINKHREFESAKVYKEAISIKANSLRTIVSTLSGGNQQKVVLSKWLMSNPQILLLDEPTRGIDIGAKFEIYKLIENLAYQGMAVLLISSEWEELMNLCDRFVILSKGACVANLGRDEIDQVHANQLVNGFE